MVDKALVMPLHEYKCETCGHREEKIHYSSDPFWLCFPICCGASMTRLLSAPAVHFKGSGFYETDYRDKEKS